jgi:SAM-dependent methyltransferase
LPGTGWSEEGRSITVADLRNFFRYWSRSRRVDGWLTEAEALLLFTRAIRPEVHRIIEIGCWKGRSSTLLAQIARDYGKEFETVDDFSGRGDLAEGAAAQDVKGKFLAHMDGLPYRLWHPTQLPERVQVPGGFDLAYIDGCHLEDAVRRDIETLRPVTRCLVGHDYSLAEVRKVVDDLLPGRTKPVFDLWMWDRDGRTPCPAR